MDMNSWSIRRLENTLSGMINISTGIIIYHVSKAYVNPGNIGKMIYVASFAGIMFSYGIIKLTRGITDS